MSIKLVQLSADMASFNNQDPSEMLDRLRSGLAGEAEPLRKYGVFISEARVKTEAFRMGIAEYGEELTDAQKIQARFNIIMQDTEKQQGDFARTIGESLPNQIRVLKAEITDLLAELGQRLLPVAVEVAKAFVDLVQAMGPLLDLFAKLAPLVGIIAKGFELMLSPIAKVIDLLRTGVPVTDEFVQVAGNALIQMEGQKQKADLAAAGISNLTGATSDVAAATEDATDAAEDNTEAMRDQRLASLALSNSFLGIFDSANQVAEAQREVNRLERQGKEDTKAYDSAVVDLLEAQLGLEDAVVSYARDLADAGRTQKEVEAKVRDLGRQVGLTKGEVDDIIDRIREYIRQLNGIPKDVKTTVTASFVQVGEHTWKTGGDFQHGGVVTRTGLAMVHKGEVFSGVNNEMGFGSSSNVTVNIGTVIGGTPQQVARGIRDELVKLGNRNAGTGL